MGKKDFKLNIGYNIKDEKRDLTILDKKYKKDKKVINVNGIKLNVIYVDGMKVGEKKNI